jgi:HK97 family phage portal protein
VAPTASTDSFPAPFEEHTAGFQFDEDLAGSTGEIRSDSLNFDSFNELGNILGELMTSGRVSRNQGGISVIQQVGALASTWIHVCIQCRREGIVATPLRLWQNKADGTAGEEVTNPEHPYLHVLENPNPMDTRAEFWDQTVNFYDLTGNALWLKVRGQNNRKVQELWVLPSQFIVPVHTKAKLLYGYAMQTAYGDEVIIPAEDIVHFKAANPRDRFWGLGTLAAAADSMKAFDMVKASRLAAFNNDILASLYFQCKDSLTRPQWIRLMGLLRERYAGYTKAGRPLLLENGLDVKRVNPTPKEMEFRGSAEDLRDEICAIFRVPPLLAMVVKNANNSNTASQERVWEKYTVAPLCVRFQERINKDLTPEFGPNLEAEFESPVQQDKVEQSKIDAQDIISGKSTANEIRARDGLDTVPYGDGPPWWYQLRAQMLNSQAKIEQAKVDQLKLQQQQVVEVQDPTDGNGEQTPGGPDANVSGGEDANADTAWSDAQDARSVPRNTASRNAVRAEGPALEITVECRPPSAARALLIRTVSNDYAELEDETVPTLRRYFVAQKRRILANLETAFGGLIPPGSDAEVDGTRLSLFERRKAYFVTAGGVIYARLFPDGETLREVGNEEVARLGSFVAVPDCRYHDGEWAEIVVRTLDAKHEDQLDDWLRAADALAESMLPKLRKAMQKGGGMQYSALGTSKTFDLNDPLAEEWLRGKDRDYWNDTVGATTKKLLSEKLAKVMEEGPSWKKLTAAVNEVMDGRIKSSAMTIARTETLGAYSSAADIVRTDLGVNEKEWLSTLDARTRTTHAMAHGQKVAQNGLFHVGDSNLRYPGDPAGSAREIVNCRCTAVSIMESVGSLGPAPGPGPQPAITEKPKKKPATKKPKKEPKPAKEPKQKPSEPEQPKGFEITYSGNTSESFRGEVASAADSIPKSVRDRVEGKYGARIVTNELLTNHFTDLKGVCPNGWPPGSTWDEAEGLFQHRSKTIFCSEFTQASGLRSKSYRVSGVIRHEYGHAFDTSGTMDVSFISGGSFSSRQAFKDAYSADLNALKSLALEGDAVAKDAVKHLDYYLQQGYAGRDEAFAEGFAITNGGGGGSIEETRHFRRFFPTVLSTIEGIVKAL